MRKFFTLVAILYFIVEIVLMLEIELKKKKKKKKI